MSFNVGDIVKRKNGTMNYIVLKNNSSSKFGKYIIKNLLTNRTYNETLSNTIWIKRPDLIFIKKKIKTFKFLWKDLQK
jgi:hypothetical protein